MVPTCSSSVRGFPVKTLKEFVEYAKARPGKLNFGGGIGTPPHLAGELLNSLAKIKMTHVPYKGVEPGDDRPDEQ